MSHEGIPQTFEHEEEGVKYGGDYLPKPPSEIILEAENNVELKINADGKKYETEENGQFYGGDYLPKIPAEINIDEETAE